MTRADTGALPRVSVRERTAAGLVRAVLALVDALPRERAIAAAGVFGRSWARVGGPRTRAALEHLAIAFPEWSERERREVAARSFANLARSVVEFASLGRLTPEQRRALATVEGWENLEAGRRQSPEGGIVCLTGHYGSWETLVAIMVAHGIPIAVVHRPRKNPLLDELLAGLRAHTGAEMLPRGSAARAALRALRDGKVVAMTLDQNASRKEGVFVPFFGRPACTRDGPARVALHTGAAVLPVFIERIGESMHHRVRILPALALVGSEGRGADAAALENTARMTAAIEDAIRRAPDQWIWTHLRWKTKPRAEIE